MPNKTSVRCIFLVVFFVSSSAVGAESYPPFNEKYWQEERDKADGKIRRGIILGAVGVGSTAFTAWLMVKASRNPEQYLAYSLVSGIATIGMTLHGFLSIDLGREERDKADYFLDRYAEGRVSRSEEEAHYLASEQITTRKTILFGTALAVQAAVLLGNGIALSHRRSRGVDLGGVKIWPSFLMGGLLLAGGGAIIAAKSVRHRALGDLEEKSHGNSMVLSIEPFFGVDEAQGALSLGLAGQVVY
jgi:hypothetical protein